MPLLTLGYDCHRIFVGMILYLLKMAGGGGHKHSLLLDIDGECHLQNSAVEDKSLSQLCHNTAGDAAETSSVAFLFCTVKCGDQILCAHLTTKFNVLAFVLTLELFDLKVKSVFKLSI